MLNPGVGMIGVEPRNGEAGKAGFSFTVPTTPPMQVVVLFDRNESEEFNTNFKKVMDISKGISK